MREMERAARRRPRPARRRTARRTRTTCATRGDRGTSPRSTAISAGGMPTRVKCLHVLVGARPRRRPGRQPARRRGAGRAGRWWAGGPCRGRRPARERPRPVGRRDRLRHQRDAAAGRRRRPTDGTLVDARPAHGDRAAGRGRRPHRVSFAARRSSAPSPPGRVRRRDRAPRRAERVRFVATSRQPRRRQPRRLRRRASRERLGVAPEVITGQEEARCPSPAPSAACPPGRDPRRPSWSTSAAARPSSSSAPTVPSASASVDIGCVRMTERHLHDDPPTADAGRRRPAPTSRPPSAARGAGVPLDGRRASSALAGSVTTVAAMALDLPTYDAASLHGAACPAARRRRRDRPAAGDDPRRAGRPARSCTRAGSTSSAAARWCCGPSWRPPGPTDVIVSETDILDGIVYSLAAD